MKNVLYILVVILLVSVDLQAQNPYKAEQEAARKDTIKQQKKLTPAQIYQQRYEERLKKTHIDGVYIPMDLFDCFKVFDEGLSVDAKNTLSNYTLSALDSVVNKSNEGVGAYIRNSWGLYEGSRLSKYFKDIGLSFPEDISMVVLEAYQLHLKDQKIDPKALFQKYKERRNKIIAERKRKQIGRYSD